MKRNRFTALFLAAVMLLSLAGAALAETPSTWLCDELTELHVMRESMGEWPMLMLDDVMSELDPSRRRQLIGRLKGIQTFVTCTDADDLAGAEVGQVWRVSAGELIGK